MTQHRPMTQYCNHYLMLPLNIITRLLVYHIRTCHLDLLYGRPCIRHSSRLPDAERKDSTQCVPRGRCMFNVVGGALEPYSCYSKCLACYRIYFKNIEGKSKNSISMLATHIR